MRDINKMNRLLYLGDIWVGATSLHRLVALQDIGFDIQKFDTTYSLKGFFFRILNYLLRKIIHIRLNFLLKHNAIYSFVEKNIVDVDFLWVDKGVCVSDKVLRRAKELNPDVIIVHYSPDDMMNPDNQTHQYLNCIPLYDYHITTKSFNVAELKQKGAQNVIFINNSFEPSVHRKINITPEDEKRLGCLISFIGDYEEDRFKQIQYLAQNGIKVRVWGTWQKARNLHPNIELILGGLWEDDYAKALNASKINLCFLRKVNRDVQTQRSVEIPACGGFMLAERTEEHKILFKEDEEAVFFSSKEELLEKVVFYLENEDLRNQIAEKGYQKAIANYTNQIHLRFVINTIRQDKFTRK